MVFSLFVIKITHVIKEIQLFQQTPYRIEHHRRVTTVISIFITIFAYCLINSGTNYRSTFLLQCCKSTAASFLWKTEDSLLLHTQTSCQLVLPFLTLGFMALYKSAFKSNFWHSVATLTTQHRW